MPDGVFGEGRLVRWTLIALAVGFLVLFLVLPLLAVFTEALRRGADAFFASFDDADTQAAIRLTLLVAAIAGRSTWCSACRLPGRSPSSSFPARAC
jgi:sulfate transport system permease protein